jgi:Tol biopolymer transport system component
MPGSPWRLMITGEGMDSPRAVPLERVDVMGPRFHPNGRSLVFFTWPVGLRVGRVNLDGSGLQWLTGSGEECQYPDISPDGRLLAYVGSQGRILVRPVMGGIPREVAQGTTPSFSPDGLWLAFARGRSYESGIGLVGVDGQGLRWLTARGAWPTWMSDGRAVGFIDTGADGFQRAWQVPVDGRPPTLLTAYRWRTTYSPFVTDPATGDLITTDGIGDTSTLWLAELF